MRKALAVTVVVLGLGAIHGCSCDDNGTGMDLGEEDMAVDTSDLAGMVMPSSDGGCTATGQACTTAATCCSGQCNGTICVAGACGTAGAQCTNAGECCTLNCGVGGQCDATQCVSDGQPCSAGGTPCCSTQCVNGSCQALNTTCKTAGNTCGGDGECCSKKCIGGKCAAPSSVSYCTQPGDICFHDNDCCGGVCTIAMGATAGTCATLPTSCVIDGLVCNGCNTCCSSFCAPFGGTGVKICQPASGCHVTGDLCHVNSDCCGGDPTQIGTIPGGGLVKCVPVPGFPQIGACSNPVSSNCPMGQNCGNSCVPEGDICHFKGNGGCSSNSTRNDCCAAPGNSGVCKLDSLGVPRCYGLGMCVMPGGACASSADCCMNAPCVPDATGHLHCGAMCVMANGTCTTTADCCTGLQCVVPPGSLQGTCTTPTNPNPTPDGGAPPDLLGAPACALYGQACSTTTPCCANEGSCLRPYANGSTACTAGDTDCTCYNPLM